MKKAMLESLDTYNRSAWKRGVAEYARDLLDDVTEAELQEAVKANQLEKLLLNGAGSWRAYSWGGCALVYNMDIAYRLCTTSEYKRTHSGERRPNAREDWLDVQARALYQAAQILVNMGRNLQRMM